MTAAGVDARNQAVVLRFLAELDAGNAEIPNELFSPDALWYMPANSSEPMSREASVGLLRAFFAGFPRWRHEIQDVVASGDRVVVRLVDSSTHEGSFQGIPATRAHVQFGVISIFRIVEGKIVEIREEADRLGFFGQIGMELRPKVAPLADR